jgi:hypothetical protein
MDKYMCATYREGKGYPVFLVTQTPSGSWHNGKQERLCVCQSWDKAMKMTGTMNSLIAASRGLM